MTQLEKYEIIDDNLKNKKFNSNEFDISEMDF